VTRIKRIWFKALGEKASPNNKDADAVAWVRTFIILQAIVTNVFIVVGIIHNWN
jgi:hypothetical protein